MNISDIAEQYGLPEMDFYKFVRNSANGIKHSLTSTDVIVDDDDVADIVQVYHTSNSDAIEKKAALEAEAQAEALLIQQIAITSSYNFEGYRIVRYGGYVSGDEVISLSADWFSGDAESMEERLKTVRQVAIWELKQAAVNIGCNAVIALDFDYINLETHSILREKSNMYLGLTANGTAVQIEKL